MNGPPPPSPREVMATMLARELDDGERVTAGSSSPVPRAAVLLAHLEHGPNMRVFSSLAYTNHWGHEDVTVPSIAMDTRATIRAEGFIRHEEGLSMVPLIASAFFIGALQVDPYGNSNLIGLRAPDGRLLWRGPGPHATTSLANNVGRYYLVVDRHAPEVLVERCDYVSSVGWGTPGAPRESLALPGGGPVLCVTPLACFDFGGDRHRMRLRSVHPGATLEEVRDRTGFAFEAPARPPTTVGPTSDQLRLLREVIDRRGELRI